MRKLFLFFALLAGIAVMTGCQKDQDVVTLKAVIGQDTKAYFSTPYQAYWDSDDQVYVAGLGIDPNSYNLSFPDNNDITTFATIEGVSPSSIYCAIYPATAVKPGTVSIPDASGSGITATIYFDPHQKYIWENNHQRINMPMGAVAKPTSTGTATLYFKNLCSILRVNVNNRYGSDFDVMKLTAHAMGASLTGYADVTLSEAGASMTPIAASENVLTLYNPSGESLGTISSGSSKSFDIVVPKFTNAKIVLEVEMYRHNANGTYSAIGYFADTTCAPGTATGSPVSIDLNQIKTIDLDVDVAYTNTYDYGYLEKGSDFNAHILELIRENPNTTITSITFSQHTGALVTHGLYTYGGDVVDTTATNRYISGWKEVSTPNSPHKIWAYVDGNSIRINTWGTYIYANTDCSEMFKDLTTISTIHWNNINTGGFITEDVTDMSSMFEGCTALSHIDGIGLFNTTNVTNMAYMFKGCSTLQVLTLSNFNTQNVTDNGMVGMFQGCSSLQTLDISSFTTARVTNMTNLFSGCTNINGGLSTDPNVPNPGIHIDNFVISQGTNLTNMFQNVGTSHRAAIYCSRNVYDKLHLNESVTASSIDLNRVYFPNQGDSHSSSK